jgi:hypothetical protein
LRKCTIESKRFEGEKTVSRIQQTMIVTRY